ncbi:hypothetical protein [Cyclobacterium xiamenense]|jgi:hypothetical protein|uniref:hypothetical protein n=1 Tax=Cyclobacterium xiamenense TaxID=1297121 RepID=UPI0012B9873C|nr:hypothetical protein [Cyclobacterium xiamenense]
MIFSLVGYRKIIVFALVALIVIPCSITREFSQISFANTTDQPTQKQNGNACLTFFKLEKEHKKEEKQIDIANFRHFSNEAPILAGLKTNLLFHFYDHQKEKIPTYLFYQQFLI